MKVWLSGLLFAVGIAGAMERGPGVLDIQWEEVPPVDETVQFKSADNAFTVGLAYDKKAFDSVRLPVLLPDIDPGFLDVLVSAQENAYDVSIRLDGASIFVSGDRFYQHVIQSGDENLTGYQTGGGAVFSVNQRMPEASFGRFGANYSVTIDCQNVEDSRCLSEEYLRTIYQRLKPVGGQP